MSLTKRQIREAFDLFDSDQRGAIQASELELILKSLGFVDLPKQEINALMRSMDKSVSLGNLNRSGEIEYPEFEAAVLKMNQAGSIDEIWTAYKLFDLNQTGRITFEDLKRVAAEQNPVVGDDVLRRILEECAVYPQKGLSFEEWKVIMTSVFRGK